MSSYVTLTNESNPPPTPDWTVVAASVRTALSNLDRDARELGVTPDWDTVELGLDYATIDNRTWSETVREVVGRKYLTVSVRAETKEDE